MSLIRFDQIQSADWQPAIGQLGSVVTDLDDVGQCIQTILQTPVGSVPLTPLFGSRLHLYLDAPVNLVAPDLVRETTDALQLWEPRIIVMQAVPALLDNGMAITVTWAPIEQPDDVRNTVVSL
jgi:phage baseplate assembly protein W